MKRRWLAAIGRTAAYPPWEEESIVRGIMTMYTHTEKRNTHLIDLNLKLGYFEVRTGPIWDEIPRVSLMKHLVSKQAQQSAPHNSG